ncbi:hypothetical protein LCGC14_2271950, partial [marine sediment metagenome]
GYDFLQNNYSVYYHDASTSSNIKQLADFVKSCGENDLVILDNAHAGFDSINNMLCEDYKHEFLLLVTSRNVERSVTQSQHPDNSQEGFSYIEIFKEEYAYKELCANEKTIKHIIDQYVGDVIPEDRIGNIDTLKDKCKADYNILRFYVQAWKRKGCVGCLSDVHEKEILEDVFTRYLRHKPHQLELLKIAALSQFEIDVDSRWIDYDLEELQKDGLVQLVETEELNSGRYVSWIRIRHPSVAIYFLKAAAYKHRHIANRIDEFGLQCIYSYLKTKPQNLLKVIGSIPLVEGESFYNGIYCNKTLFKVLCKVIEGFDLNQIIDNHYYIVMYLLSFIEMNGEDASAQIKELLHVYSSRIKNMQPDTSYLKKLTQIILLSYPSSLIRTLFENLDFRDIGEKTKEGLVGFGDIIIFMIQLKKSRLPKPDIEAFCSELDFKYIGQQIRSTNNWEYLHWFLTLNVTGNFSTDNIYSCFNELNYKELAKQASKSTLRVCDCIFSFILSSRGIGISEDKLITFFKVLNFKKLGLCAREGNEDVFALLNFIRLALSAKVPGSSIRFFCSNLDFRKLGKQAIENKVESEDISEFASIIQN